MKQLRKLFIKSLIPIVLMGIWNLFFFCFDGYFLYKNMMEGHLGMLCFWIVLTTLMGWYLYKDILRITGMVVAYREVNKVGKELLKSFDEFMKSEQPTEDIPHEEIK